MPTPPEDLRYTYPWFIAQFNKSRDQAIRFSLPIDNHKFIQRPAEGSWSIAECLEHLVSFGNLYLKSIREGLEKAPAGHADPGQSFTPGLICKGVIRLFAPPYRLKMKTFKPFEPISRASFDKERVIKRYDDLQEAFIGELETAMSQSIDLRGAKTSHPLVGLLKMNVAECFAIVEVHQRRHLWQAEQILNKISRD